MNVTVSQLLEDGQAFITNERNWCTRAMQKRAGIWPFRRDQYCATGALRRAAEIHFDIRPGFNVTYRTAADYLDKVAVEIYGFEPSSEYKPAWRVNDTRGHEAVMEMYDEAIRMAQAQQIRHLDFNVPVLSA